MDRLCGVGGIPRGFIVELYGEENTGKTTMAFHAIAAAQRAGIKCLMVDMERTFLPKRAEELGCDLKKLDVLKCATGEEYIDTLEELVKAGTYGLIVIDSIGDLSSRVIMEKQAGDATIGVQAKLMARFVRMIAPYVDLHNLIFIGINHERVDMDGRLYTMGGKRWSEKKKISIRFRRSKNVLKTGETVVGKQVRLSVTKNHVAGTEGMELYSNLLWATGYSYAQDLLDDAIQQGVITKEGNTHYFAGEKLGLIGKSREWIAIEENAAKVKEALSV
jgi:recombination protein RecA